MILTIESEPLLASSPHFTIPIRFETRERIGLRALAAGRIETIAMPLRLKNYDAIPDSNMAETLSQFNTSNWALLAAHRDGTRVGGAIVAFDTPAMDLLEGRSDIATLLDIRVAPSAQGTGIGRRLFAAAEAWSRQVGAKILTIETQDINVSACRFYHAAGCTVRTIREHAYPGLDEHQIIWQRVL